MEHSAPPRNDILRLQKDSSEVKKRESTMKGEHGRNEVSKVVHLRLWCLDVNLGPSLNVITISTPMLLIQQHIKL